MESFDDLGLEPELVEALAAEGIEIPSSLQADAIPVLRRGNPAVLRAGPGAGAGVAWGTALLSRLEPGGGQPVALVLVTTPEVAEGTARSLARLGMATGHRCAALQDGWALPGHADILVSTPAALEAAIRSADVKVDGVQALVIEGASMLLDEVNRPRVELVLETLEAGNVQGIVVSDPISPMVREWIDAHLRRAVFIPSDAAGGDPDEAPLERGVLELHVAEGGELMREAVGVIAQILDEGSHHVLLFCRSEDRAADMGDLLTLHGFLAGAPGDPSVPVWLGLDPLADRKTLAEEEIPVDLVTTLSLDPPLDADTLDRRHGGGQSTGVLVAEPREVPHLRRLAKEAGYRLKDRGSTPAAMLAEVETFRESIRQALRERDLSAYVTLLDPLLEETSGVEVAAALAALLRDQGAADGSAASARGATAGSTPGDRPPAWARLFISVGSKDGAGPGDLLGAITGEAGLKGDEVGRIDVKDTFSRVDVQDHRAQEVIQALNGTSIRGRSVRVDFDRGGARDHGRGEKPGGGRGEKSGRGAPPSRRRGPASS